MLEMIFLEIKTGYLYHIKDEYFDDVNDDSLMQNRERGKKRPTYFTIKDGDILWFIPISSKVDKYQRIINNKIEKYGFCNTIIIRKIADEDAAIREFDRVAEINENIIRHLIVRVEEK